MSKKKAKLMRLDPTMEMLLKLISGDTDVGAPELDMNSAWLDIKFTKWKMHDLADISTHRATISENHARVLRSKLEVMSTMMNFPLLLEQARDTIKHQRKIHRLEQRKAELTNLLMETEAKRTGTELSQMLKELGIGTAKD